MPVKQKWERRGPDSACTWWPRNRIVKYFGSEVIRRRDRFCGLVPVGAKKASTTWKKVSGCQKSAEQWSIALKIGACPNKISALCLEQFNTNRSEGKECIFSFIHFSTATLVLFSHHLSAFQCNPFIG